MSIRQTVKKSRFECREWRAITNYTQWVWAPATPRQRAGPELAGRFGAGWIETDIDELMKARRAQNETSLPPDAWNFDATKQFMRVAWSKVIAEELALTAFAFALLLCLPPRLANLF
jgi:hypothetical protein